MHNYAGLIAECQRLIASSEKLRHRSQAVWRESTTQSAWLRSAAWRSERALVKAQRLVQDAPERVGE